MVKIHLSFSRLKNGTYKPPLVFLAVVRTCVHMLYVFPHRTCKDIHILIVEFSEACVEDKSHIGNSRIYFLPYRKRIVILARNIFYKQLRSRFFAYIAHLRKKLYCTVYGAVGFLPAPKMKHRLARSDKPCKPCVLAEKFHGFDIRFFVAVGKHNTYVFVKMYNGSINSRFLKSLSYFVYPVVPDAQHHKLNSVCTDIFCMVDYNVVIKIICSAHNRACGSIKFVFQLTHNNVRLQLPFREYIPLSLL